MSVVVNDGLEQDLTSSESALSSIMHRLPNFKRDHNRRVDMSLSCTVSGLGNLESLKAFDVWDWGRGIKQGISEATEPVDVGRVTGSARRDAGSTQGTFSV